MELPIDIRKAMADAVAARREAEALVRSLEELRAQTDPEARDLYKRVTGNSSLENAVAAAKRTVESYDRLIAELSKQATFDQPASNWNEAPR